MPRRLKRKIKRLRRSKNSLKKELKVVQYVNKVNDITVANVTKELLSQIATTTSYKKRLVQTTSYAESKGCVTVERLFVCAMLTQACYQEKLIPSGNFQTNYQEKVDLGQPPPPPYFNGPNPTKNLRNILEKVDYKLIGDIKFINDFKDTYRAFTCEISFGVEHYFVVSIRGTNNLQNWWTDAQDFHLVDGPVGLPDSKIVNSMFNVYNENLKTPIMEAVNAYFKINPHVKNVYFMGHSLGGPFAAYAAYDMIKEKETNHDLANIDVNLYTYNSPRPGNKVFAEELNQNTIQNLRHFIDKDIVHLIPTRAFTGAYHTGVGYKTKIQFDQEVTYLPLEDSFLNGNLLVNVLETQEMTTEDLSTDNFVVLLAKEGVNRVVVAHLFYAEGSSTDSDNPWVKNIPFLHKQVIPFLPQYTRDLVNQLKRVNNSSDLEWNLFKYSLVNAPPVTINPDDQGFGSESKLFSSDNCDMGSKWYSFEGYHDLPLHVFLGDIDSSTPTPNEGDSFYIINRRNNNDEVVCCMLSNQFSISDDSNSIGVPPGIESEDA